MTETTAVAPRPEKAIVTDSGRFANLMDTNRFEHIQRVGTMFANSSLVPDHFRGKQADCVIAVEMALRLDIHPFALMQSLYIVHGKPGMEAKMAIALINSSGLYVGPLQFKLEGEGMKRKCTAFATDKASGQVCSAEVTMEMAKAEGWIDKSGSKWKTMPDMMLQYRSASFFGRLNCPQVLFGMQTREELDDIEVDVTPVREAEQPRRRTLKDKVVGAAVEAELVTTNVNSEPAKAAAPEPAHQDPIQPSQEAAGAAQEPEPAQPPPEAEKAPAISFDDLLKYAKRAKDKGQADVVRDAMKEGTYSEAEQQQVNDILNSKTFASE